MNDILVLGIGNYLLRDEGFGIHAIKALEAEGSIPGVDFLDGGPGGLFLIGELQTYKHIIMIDASLDKFPSGTVRLIIPKYSKDYPPHLSAHEFGLKDMIDAMIFLEKLPNIHLIAVSVKEFHELSMELSPSIHALIPRVSQMVKNIISVIQSGSSYFSPPAILQSLNVYSSQSES